MKHEYLVMNIKEKAEQKVICDDIDTAVLCAVVLHGWWIDDCIATEIEEYCALTPFGE